MANFLVSLLCILRKKANEKNAPVYIGVSFCPFMFDLSR